MAIQIRVIAGDIGALSPHGCTSKCSRDGLLSELGAINKRGFIAEPGSNGREK
jgi:hypothetical protein